MTELGQITPESPAALINRELSWLSFARRVLALAEDPGQPLLERVKFAGIMGTIYDEFAMKRTGGLLRQARKGWSKRGPDGLTSAEVLEACRAELRSQQQLVAALVDEQLRPALRDLGLPILDAGDLSPSQREFLARYCRDSVEAILVPLAADAAHPFPFISNLGLNLRALDHTDPAAVFDEIRRGDILVHLPYHSFDTSILRFLQSAAVDPAVLAIKLTIYRTGRRSPIVQALKEAARRGKQVAVLVEITARFDEAPNISWGKELEEAGAHVAYGVERVKTHVKLTLVVREEPDWMTRNLSRRMEVVAPVCDPVIKAELETILRTYEEDNCSAWDMQPDGDYLLRHPAAGESRRAAQEAFIKRSASALQLRSPCAGDWGKGYGH